MPNLQGKTALITGGANGIGRATVDRFLADGAAVIAMDRALDGSAKAGERVRWFEGDVTDALALRDAAELAKEQFGRLDVCVANAGVGRLEEFLGGSPASWQEVLAVNLLGVMATLQAAARLMVEDGGGGRLLATASIAGLHGEPLSAAYSASKGGVLALTRALAIELAPHRITVNAVAPGQVATALNRTDARIMGEREGKTLEEYERDFLQAAVPLQRIGDPAEVAALFAFLASEDAAFITGATFRIDGGELAT
jgi:NAD(P)-dependent dehydrogenase (short-subunit alcohol dehydrogenase family)